MKRLSKYLVLICAVLWARQSVAQDFNPIHGYPSNPAFSTVTVGTAGPFPASLPISALSYAGMDPTGTNDCATAMAAMSDYVNAHPGSSLTFPSGTYKYSGGFDIQVPTKIVGDKATLNYVGTGIALALGGLNLTVGTMQTIPYELTGFRFIGGATASSGVFVRKYVINPRIYLNSFSNFTLDPAAAVRLEGENWAAVIDNNLCEATDGFTNLHHCLDSTSVTGVNSTQMRITKNVCTGSTNTWAMKIDGAAADITEGNKIEGFSPAILITPLGNNSKITNNYFECSGVGCIQFSGALDGLNIGNNYANLHNDDPGTSKFIVPIDGSATLTNSWVQDNRIGNSYYELINLNALAQGPIVTRGNLIASLNGTGSPYPQMPVTVSNHPEYVEDHQQNLLIASQQMSNGAAWSLYHLTVAEDAVAPNGTTTADTVTVANTDGAAYNLTVANAIRPNTLYTFSWWAKRGTMTTAHYYVWDNTAGAELVASTSYYADTSSAKWQRIAVSFTTPANCVSLKLYPLREPGAGGSTGTMFIWGAQLNEGAVPWSYSETKGLPRP